MSIQLGSEHTFGESYKTVGLTPMSIQLGSEQNFITSKRNVGLTPMSIQLGSEPLQSQKLS